MKHLLTLAFLTLALTGIAQETSVLEQNGISISYTLTKLSAGEKKDTYLLNVKAMNKNTFDMFYQGPKNGVNPFLCEITIRKIDTYVYMTAPQSKLATLEGKLHYLRANDVLTAEKEFKVASNEKPIITAKLFGPLRPISDFY
ncbi:hypothetical protein B0I27_11737 [Arcticibacter pallidicorallinus]|uniref:Lipocalin-like domain-containing protein n=1 Tax=Arcticibacter pallidicorallinus TaxID=1259464 RepID=A0A2T0TQX7_9SPHI|nr:hypothetical protein [Arcticibacter pallidicorallinus]PRY48049.1 hypothetical protein B0I27_11737 [Arcticibacter pallidicorallinus]